MTDRPLQQALAAAVDALEFVGCQFWACTGPPEGEPEDMITCHRCAALADAREALRRPRRLPGEVGSIQAAEADRQAYLDRCIPGRRGGA